MVQNTIVLDIYNTEQLENSQSYIKHDYEIVADWKYLN